MRGLGARRRPSPRPGSASAPLPRPAPPGARGRASPPATRGRSRAAGAGRRPPARARASPGRWRRAARCRRWRCRSPPWSRLNDRSAARRQHPLQRHGGDLRVGGDEAQHGRHVGRDHAAALGDAGDRHLRPADLRLAHGALGEGVGGHDGARGVRPRRRRAAPRAARAARRSASPSAAARRSRPWRRGTPRAACSPPVRPRPWPWPRQVSRPALAGEDVGVARRHHQRPRLAARAAPPGTTPPARRGSGCS